MENIPAIHETWRDLAGLGYLSSLYLLDRDDDRPIFHGAFVPAVARALILRHTEPGAWLWDPFAGSGTSGIVAEELGRQCFMSDLSPAPPVFHMADARFARVIESPRGTPMLAECKGPPPFLFPLIILHPPYHSIIKFSEKPQDLSNQKRLASFLSMWSDVCKNAARHLAPGGVMAVVVGDIWLTAEQAKAEPAFRPGVFPLGFTCMQLALEAAGPGGRLLSIVVKDIKNNQARARLRNLWLSRYYAWGAVEFAHEYIISVKGP